MKVKKMLAATALILCLCAAAVMTVTFRQEANAFDGVNGFDGALRYMAYNAYYEVDFDYKGIEEEIALSENRETTIWVRFTSEQVYMAAGEMESSFRIGLDFINPENDMYIELYLLDFHSISGSSEIYLPLTRSDGGTTAYFYSMNQYFIEFMEMCGLDEIYLSVCIAHRDYSYQAPPWFRFEYNYHSYSYSFGRYAPWIDEYPQYYNPEAFIMHRFRPSYTGDHVLRYTGEEPESFYELRVYEEQYPHLLYEGFDLPYFEEMIDYDGNIEYLTTIFLEDDRDYYFAMPARCYDENGRYPLSIHRLYYMTTSANDEYIDHEIIYYLPNVPFSNIRMVANHHLIGDNYDTQFLVLSSEYQCFESPKELTDFFYGMLYIRSSPSFVTGYRSGYDCGIRRPMLHNTHQIQIDLYDNTPFEYNFAMIHANKYLQPIAETIVYSAHKGLIYVHFPIDKYPFFFTSGDAEFYLEIVIKGYGHSFQLKAPDGQDIPCSTRTDSATGSRIYRFKFDRALKARLETNAGSYFKIVLNNLSISSAPINFQMYVY